MAGGGVEGRRRSLTVAMMVSQHSRSSARVFPSRPRMMCGIPVHLMMVVSAVTMHLDAGWGWGRWWITGLESYNALMLYLRLMYNAIWVSLGT